MALSTETADQRDVDPVLNLWLAVLENAIDDLLGRNVIEQKKALHWFRSDDDCVGSFVFICNALDVDHLKMRKKILGLTK